MLEPAAVFMDQEVLEVSGRAGRDHVLVHVPLLVARKIPAEQPQVPAREIPTVSDLAPHKDQNAVDVKSDVLDLLERPADDVEDFFAEARADRLVGRSE